MAIKSQRPIYDLVEGKLRKAKRPMTCSELMDDPAIREEAVSEFGGPDNDVQQASNKLSDVLGFMWRKGVLMRYPAPKDSLSFARYAYEFIVQPEQPLKAVPPPVKLKTKTLLGVVEHDDCVELEFEKFIIYVKPKK